MSRIVRLDAVKVQTGLGRSAIYAKIAKGEFPRPIKLGPRAVGWLESEIQEWIMGRHRPRDQGQLPDFANDRENELLALIIWMTVNPRPFGKEYPEAVLAEFRQELVRFKQSHIGRDQ